MTIPKNLFDFSVTPLRTQSAVAIAVTLVEIVFVFLVVVVVIVVIIVAVAVTRNKIQNKTQNLIHTIC